MRHSSSAYVSPLRTAILFSVGREGPLGVTRILRPVSFRLRLSSLLSPRVGFLRDEECLLFLLRYTWVYILINAIEFRRAKERSAKGNECALKGIIEDKVVERTW